MLLAIRMCCRLSCSETTRVSHLAGSSLPTGACIADGSVDFARKYFCESAEVFLDLCRDAVDAAELRQWSQREYELLSVARGIAGA